MFVPSVTREEAVLLLVKGKCGVMLCSSLRHAYVDFYWFKDWFVPLARATGLPVKCKRWRIDLPTSGGYIAAVRFEDYDTWVRGRDVAFIL